MIGTNSQLQKVREEAETTLNYHRRRDGTDLVTPFVIEYPVPPMSILAWLIQQSEWPHFYWANRDRSFEIGASGLTLPLEVREGNQLSSIHEVVSEILEHHPQKDRLCFLGGNTFFNNGAKDRGWENFPRSGFFLPKRYLMRSEGRLKAGVIDRVLESDTTETLADRACESLRKYFGPPSAVPSWTPTHISQRADCPNFKEWEELVSTATTQIRQSEMSKVVLARRTDLTLSHPINPYSLLQAFRGAFGNCYSILYAPYPSKCLIGISPECLLKIHEDKIFSDALAGTVARSPDEEEDTKLAQTLLQSGKIRREYDIVLDDVAARLSRFGRIVEKASEPNLLKLSTVQHLVSQVGAVLSPHTSVFDVLRCLHPTPAVGGFPREVGLQFIQQHEPFVRGWYGAPIGVLMRSQAEFAVSIRSALLEDVNLSLYTGCGIVNGSEPLSEWDELESKLQTFLDFFGDSGHDLAVGI